MSEDLPIIVTGARGRIGAALLRHFKALGLPVYGYSRVAGDGLALLDDLFVDEMLSRPHVLFHCAWSSVPLVSETHRGIEWKSDLPLLWRMLEAIAAGNGLAESHFIFLSSGGTVYGNAVGGPSREADPLKPIGWHGFAKVHTEHLLEEFERRAGLRITRVRLANPYGFVSHSTKPQGVIPFLIEAALQERVFRVWGDGTARKDYLYVSDFLSAMEAIRKHRLAGPINVCHGHSASLLEIVKTVEEATGKTVSLAYEEAPAWDVRDSCLDNSLLRSLTGWEPKVGLQEGVRKLLDHYTRQQ